MFNKFPLENHAVYEIMWKNIVQPDRPKMTTWRTCISCWIPKATNIHTEYVSYMYIAHLILLLATIL